MGGNSGHKVVKRMWHLGAELHMTMANSTVGTATTLSAE